MSPYRVIHRGHPYMRGSGVGSIFRSLYSWLIPLFKAGASTAVKTGAKVAKSKLGKTIAREAKKEIKKGSLLALSDVIGGKNPVPQIKDNVKLAQTKIAKVVKRQANPPKKKAVVKRKKTTPLRVPTKAKRVKRTNDIW